MYYIFLNNFDPNPNPNPNPNGSLSLIFYGIESNDVDMIVQ